MLRSLSLLGGKMSDAPGVRRGGRLLAGLVWLVLAAATVGLFIRSLPTRFEDVRQRFEPQLGLSLIHNRAGEPAVMVWGDYPAQQAGLLEGDVLVAVNGVPVPAAPGESLDEVLPTGAAGTALTLSVRTGDGPVRDHVVLFGGENALALAGLGLSTGFITAFALAAEILLALVCLAVAAVIVWRSQGQPLALFFSLAFTVAQLGTSASVLALYNWQPVWRPALDAWFAFALTALLLFFYLFPDRQFRPRWTLLLAGAAVVWWVVQVLNPALYPWRMAPLPGFLVIAGWMSTGVGAQLYRFYRHASPIQRQQTKWVVLGTAAATLGVLGRLAPIVWPPEAGLATVLNDLIAYPAAEVFRVLLPVTIGIAILRYRLWDIDLIINRALVYTGLTLSVVGIYVLCVGVLGALIRTGAGGLLSVLATGLVAVLVQPLRDRLQRGVNRMMYGERDDPVTMLNRLGQRLEVAVTPEALLPSLAETVAQALKLPYVAIELASQGQAPETVAYPPGASPPAAPGLAAWPLVHQGETVGQMLVAPRGSGEALSPLDRHLLENIARQASLAVHAIGLTRELQRARQRSVAALEEERRRLRRDLHDGLGPALASQGLKLAAASQHLRANPDAALALIDGVLAQNLETVADVRRLVYGLRPPALDERGLAEAIRDHLGQGAASGLQVVVGDLPPEALPLPAAVEVAAYRIALEAVTNIIRHARARNGSVRFALAGQGAGPARQLEVKIEDDGAGLPSALRAGVGLRSMRERAEELGGTLRLEPGLAGGTRVIAVLPLRSD